MTTERTGIEMDYCPQYRGDWLDRGERDKIRERTPPGPDGFDDRTRHSDPEGFVGCRKKKRGGFQEERFDF